MDNKHFHQDMVKEVNQSKVKKDKDQPFLKEIMKNVLKEITSKIPLRSCVKKKEFNKVDQILITLILEISIELAKNFRKQEWDLALEMKEKTSMN